MNLHISTQAATLSAAGTEARHAISIQEVMTEQPLTIGRSESLATASEMMRVHECRHLPVLEHGDLVGVLAQRDLYLLETFARIDLTRDKVDDAMSTDTCAVPPDAPLRDVARQMATEKCGCAVVIERGRVIGIFTSSDALRVLGEG